MNNAQTKAYFVKYSRTHLKAENSMKRAVLVYLTDAGARAISSFELSESDAASKVNEFLKVEPLRDVFLEMYLTNSNVFREFLLSNFNKPVEKGMSASLAISFFSQRFQNLIAQFAAERAAAYVTKIVESLRDTLRQTIEKATAQNKSKVDVAKEIKRNWKAVSSERALLIARTETTTLSGFAQMETAKEFSIPLDKVWIAARDGRTRDDHRAANGQRVKYEEDFVVGGIAMSHPGDPKGGAANVCNCRCTVAFLPRR